MRPSLDNFRRLAWRSQAHSSVRTLFHLMVFTFSSVCSCSLAVWSSCSLDSADKVPISDKAWGRCGSTSLTIGPSSCVSVGDSACSPGRDVNALRESSSGLILTIALDAIELPLTLGKLASDASSVALCDGEDTARRHESARARPRLLSSRSTGSCARFDVCRLFWNQIVMVL